MSWYWSPLLRETQLLTQMDRHSLEEKFVSNATIPFSKFNRSDVLGMLGSLEKDLSINEFKPNELKVFYTIIESQDETGEQCNISDVVTKSGMSRSTVYKTLKKLSSIDIIDLEQSVLDKREFLIKLN